MDNPKREHGGGLDAAVARYGGVRGDWVDLSTGINPVPYPIGDIPDHGWTSLPDETAQDALITAARQFWKVPTTAAVLAAPGASALIAQIPSLVRPSSVCIAEPTYNEHRAAFLLHGWDASENNDSHARVLVHPNNPTGKFWDATDVQGALAVIDESFCDTAPDQSLVQAATRPGTIVLKSFGKFWGLAGLRLGFAIGDPRLVKTLQDRLGPWPVAGPALHIGAQALNDRPWANSTITRLSGDSERLDRLMTQAGAQIAGGTPLFRLYRVENAVHWQDRLARGHVWSRTFTYAPEWVRLGLPAPDRWSQLEAALK